MQLEEYDISLLESAGKKTSTNYLEKITWVTEEKGFIMDDILMDIVSDLVCEIDRLEEKIEDRERDIQDNFKRISCEEMYG